MPKHPPGEPMTRGNMRHLGVERLVAHCLNPSCRHEGLIDVSKYQDDIEVPSFAKKSYVPSAAAEGGTSTCGPTGKSSRRNRA
jgi:hypothetical protein